MSDDPRPLLAVERHYVEFAYRPQDIGPRTQVIAALRFVLAEFHGYHLLLLHPEQRVYRRYIENPLEPLEVPDVFFDLVVTLARGPFVIPAAKQRATVAADVNHVVRRTLHGCQIGVGRQLPLCPMPSVVMPDLASLPNRVKIGTAESVNRLRVKRPGQAVVDTRPTHGMIQSIHQAADSHRIRLTRDLGH